MSTAAALPVVALALASCAQIGFDRRPLQLEHREVITSSGVRYAEEFVGHGPAAVIGDELLLDYTLSLPDGTRVDSTLDRGVPITLQLGNAPVRGLDDGLIGIQPGGRRRIVVPPELAYGAEGFEDLVPPNATIEFQVHVIEVRPR